MTHDDARDILAAAWITDHQAPKHECDAYWWAYERFDDLISREPETVREKLKSIAGPVF